MPVLKAPPAGQQPLLLEKRAQERIVFEIDCSGFLDPLELFTRAELESDFVEAKTSRGTTLLVTLNPTDTYTVTETILNIKLFSTKGSIRVVPIKAKVYP